MNKSPIDIDALEKKRLRIKEKSENPVNSQYGDKLAELLNLRTTGRDSFVNWIAGLATGAMALAFTNLASAPSDIKTILLCSGLASFLCIIFAMMFKILLEVRFSALELEISLLKNLWEGHDIRSQLSEMMESGKEITEESKQKFLRNMDESLDYLDESNHEKLKKSINCKFMLWDYSYWLTLGLFVTGGGLMAFSFVKLVLCG